jgi:hypothetical protein
VEDAVFVKDLMHFIIDGVTMPYIETLNKYLGITQFRGSDATASLPMFSPTMLEDIVLPWNLEIRKKGKELGVNAFVYSPGIYGEQLPAHFDYSTLCRCYDFSVTSMGDSNAFLRISRQPDHPIDPFLKYARDLRSRYPKAAFKIQIRVYAKLLREGPIERIIGYIKNMLDTFCPEFEVLVYLAGITVETPPEHIHAAVQSTHYYGRLPYRFIDDDASFQPKQRESYPDFLKSLNS